MDYQLFLEEPGTLDVSGRMWNLLQALLVELPFALLRLIVSGISFLLNLLDFSDQLAPLRQIFFNESRNIYLGFIGGTNGRITTTSLAYSFLMISLIYLTWQFFFGKGNFSKKVIHVIAVVCLSFAYFGNFRVDGRTVSGGIYVFDTVSNLAEELKSNLISFTLDDTSEALSGEHDYSRYYEAYIVKNTFRYINSGSMHGEYMPGQHLDESKLIPSRDLTKNELEQFEKDRLKYISDTAELNPYFRNNHQHLMEKMFMVGLAYFNALVLGFPVIFANLTISAFQFVFQVLIILFPWALMFSFIPFMKHAAFNVLKNMMGILFLPVLVSFLLSIFFYLNQTIDGLVMQQATRLLNSSQPLTLGTMPSGSEVLVIFFVMIVVKAFFLRLIWKNKGLLLKFLSDGKLDDRLINQPVYKMKEMGKTVTEKATGLFETGAGVYTGNTMMFMDGLVKTTGIKRHTENKETDFVQDHLLDEDGQQRAGAGLESLREHSGPTEKQNENKGELGSENIQNVHVVNSEDLKSNENELNPLSVQNQSNDASLEESLENGNPTEELNESLDESNVASTDEEWDGNYEDLTAQNQSNDASLEESLENEDPIEELNESLDESNVVSTDEEWDGNYEDLSVQNRNNDSLEESLENGNPAEELRESLDESNLVSIDEEWDGNYEGLTAQNQNNKLLEESLENGNPTEELNESLDGFNVASTDEEWDGNYEDLSAQYQNNYSLEESSENENPKEELIKSLGETNVVSTDEEWNGSYEELAQDQNSDVFLGEFAESEIPKEKLNKSLDEPNVAATNEKWDGNVVSLANENVLNSNEKTIPQSKNREIVEERKSKSQTNDNDIHTNQKEMQSLEKLDPIQVKNSFPNAPEPLANKMPDLKVKSNDESSLEEMISFLEELENMRMN